MDAASRYEALCDMQSCDGCHPNDAGMVKLAMASYKALMNGPPPPPQGKSNHNHYSPEV